MSRIVLVTTASPGATMHKTIANPDDQTLDDHVLALSLVAFLLIVALILELASIISWEITKGIRDTEDIEEARRLLGDLIELDDMTELEDWETCREFVVDVKYEDDEHVVTRSPPKKKQREIIL